jgi:hypothetical protein
MRKHLARVSFSGREAPVFRTRSSFLRFELECQIGYIVTVMKNNKSLLHTNKFLRNKKFREQMLVAHAAASARIEGVKDATKRAQALGRKSNGPSPKRG